MKVVCVSGYFDPIHPGHISHFKEARALGDRLIVIVNGDSSKRKMFQDLATRCQIVASIKWVDEVYATTGLTADALREIKPDIYAKGGDRNESNIPEVGVCKELDIKIRSNIGRGKEWSSSKMLADWSRNDRPNSGYCKRLFLGGVGALRRLFAA